MSAQIIDGKALAKTVRAEVKADVERFQREVGRAPGLTVVLVGQDPASVVYTRNKEKASAEAGINGKLHRMPADTSEADLLQLLDELCRADDVDGILVQLPLPAQIDSQKVLDAIDPTKDVDGFHPHNVGLLASGRPHLVPCTPLGCMRMLDEAGIDPKGKRALVIGRSNIVGKPMAHLLLARSATVTIAHSKTEDLAARCREADIVVAAIGRPRFVKADWIKEGATVLDVGINRTDEGKLCGDVDTEPAKERAGYITPVPGGVGPMTIACLLQNTLTAAWARVQKK